MSGFQATPCRVFSDGNVISSFDASSPLRKEGSVEPEHSKDKVPAEPVFLARRLLPLAIPRLISEAPSGRRQETTQHQKAEPENESRVMASLSRLQHAGSKGDYHPLALIDPGVSVTILWDTFLRPRF
jgi:hypothetical protein